MYIYYNDKLTDDLAFLQPDCQGFQFGYGVFETILITKGQPCFLDLHYQRLLKSCRQLGLDLKLDLQKTFSQALQLVKLLGITEGRLKIICFKDADFASTIMLLSSYKPLEQHMQNGVTLYVSSIKRNPFSPLTYIKSLNYMESIIAKDEAKSKGCDEALFLNINNKLCEGAMSNIFWIKDNKVFTPDIHSGILGGITRGQILDICSKLSLEYEEGSYDLTNILQAEEVFITNSLMGIMPVGKVDNSIYNIAEYKITPKLFNEYQKLISADLKINQYNK